MGACVECIVYLLGRHGRDRGGWGDPRRSGFHVDIAGNKPTLAAKSFSKTIKKSILPINTRGINALEEGTCGSRRGGMGRGCESKGGKRMVTGELGPKSGNKTES